MKGHTQPETEDVDLSVVAVGRNDDYADGFLDRFRCFLYQLCEQLGVFPRTLEIVVVDWNPPPGKPRLSEQLEFLEPPENLTIRFIEVPGAVHAALENSDRIPLFEYLAKNVGIRRALGRFVLATNPEIHSWQPSGRMAGSPFHH